MTETATGCQLALETTPVSEQQLKLTLRLQLSQPRLPISQGSVQYGFTGGTLELKLTDAHFTNFSDINHQLAVNQLLTPEQPTWQFSVPAGMKVLETALDGVTLGTIAPISQNWSIQGTFRLTPSDLLITDVEGLWRHDLHPNQQAILHRKIALLLLDILPSPLLSLEMNSSKQEVSSTPATGKFDVSSLLETIETIQGASNYNFLTLCEMANLDPNQDLTGANLRGTTIKGIDLSGANWSRVNLRGANLTDIDLSEGNLQQAKLSGADLSGAYLSHANCQQADFHRASLALANLSGANLKGANLQEANLSQTNLNDCQLEGAQFN